MDYSAVKIFQQQLPSQLHLFAGVYTSQDLLKTSLVKFAGQHETALVVGSDHLGDGSVSGDKNYAVSTLADVDADTT